MGPRRVGKTVMLYHTVQELINQGVNPQKICFITVETPIYNNTGLEQLFRYAMEALGNSDYNDWYVIFDEIQYLRGWERHLKSLVDSYKTCKFIASGSAAAALKYKSLESGAGRFTDFLLPPLTFHEYIDMKGYGHIMVKSEMALDTQMIPFYTSPHLNKLNDHFLDYLNFGGYPEVIFSDVIKRDPGRYIRQDIIDKVLLRDLPSLYGIRDVQELNALFTMIAYNSGNEFSLETLSNQSGGINKQTIKTYIEYLQSAFLIKIVRRIDQNAKKFRRNNFFKIYLTNPSLRSALFSPLTYTSEMIGHVVETAIFSQWLHRDWFTPWYARWPNGEVDMISLAETNFKPVWALEVKWSNKFYDHPEKLRALLKFCEKNNLDEPLVTTIDKEGTRKVGKINIHFIPASVYAYNVGINTLKNKKNNLELKFMS